MKKFLAFILALFLFSLTLLAFFKEKQTYAQTAKQSLWVDITKKELMDHANQWKNSQTISIQRSKVSDSIKAQKTSNLNEVVSMYQSMDSNDDGKISYQEFNNKTAVISERIYEIKHSKRDDLEDGLYGSNWNKINVDSLFFKTLASPSVVSKIYVVVEAGIYDDLLVSLGQYIEDVEAHSDYEVEIDICNGCTKEQIKGLLQTSGTEGVVLVGDTPSAYYHMISWGKYDETFPIDLYYMDLDGVWGGGTGESSSPFETHSGNRNAEIWLGRILSPDNAREIELIRNYFRKIHKYRLGGYFDISPGNLIFIDDDWQGGQCDPRISEARILYSDSQIDLVCDSTTTAQRYREKILEPFEFVTVFAHSNWRYHSFFIGNDTWENFWAHEIPAIIPKNLFYNLYACSNARYTEPGYMAGWYIFQPDYGLVAVGSTKIGGFVSYDKGYYPNLRDGNNFGTAFKAWFNELGLTDPDGLYGMTLMGDPTLVLSLEGESQTFVVCPTVGSGCDFVGPAGIQEAINAANDGDTVLVKRGIYRIEGSIAITKDIIVQGEGAVIDAQELANNGFYCAMSAKTEIRGFSIMSAKYMGIYVVESCEAIIKNNIIVNNQGGVVLVGSTHADIINNIFNFNGASIAYGGIRFYDASSAVISNNIITNNVRGIFDSRDDKSFPINCQYNLVWNNDNDYSDITCSNDISADPKFVNEAAGDFRLRSDSPAKDAGDPAILDPDGSRSDMGAYGGLGACDLDPTLPGCGEPTPFTIQGYKQNCPDGTKIILDETEETTDQPYFFHDVSGGISHTVSLELPSDSLPHNIFYSPCDCCTSHPGDSFISEDTHTFTKNTVCEGGYNYYDLYWKCVSLDFDENGVVDIEDLKILLQNWGSSPSIPEADLNSDGIVNGIDFGIMVKLIL